MAQLCQKSDNLSHLTGFWVISIESDLLSFIVYVIAFMLLLDRVSHDQIPIAATFENVDIRNASSGCDTTKI